jgi:predicted dehydrogenase
MSNNVSRRDFLKSAAIAGAGLLAAPTIWAEVKSPNEKLNIAGIGAGGQGGSDINNVSSENIVALCDVDDLRAGSTYKRFPKAKRYNDYREMLEKEAKLIDAVTIGTPDHHHAPAAAMAMKLGKHVYCEKPLTHTVHEARVLRELAAKHKVATQMGNQGTATDGLRRGVEVIQSGALGEVREVHVWTNRPIWPQGNEAILQHAGVHNALHGGGAGPEPPRTLKWDLWLGSAPWRPYDPIYLPFNWRGWWDYGTGSLGDMACHTLNLGYWALKLVNPTSVEAEVSELNPESCPLWSIIRYEFPARANLPPLKMTWYDKFKKPSIELFEGEKMSDSGLLVVGEKGKLYSNGDYGDRWMLLPKSKFEGFKGPEPSIPRCPGQGHHAEWIRACKGGPAATSNFDYAGPLTETVVLGNVAMRRAGKKLEWDAENLKVTNDADANKFVQKEYRQGWSL